MNNELVYALLGLGVHWWLGIWAAGMLIRRRPEDWRKIEDELVMLGMVFFAGSLLGAFVFLNQLVWMGVSNWFENGGRIFRRRGD